MVNNGFKCGFYNYNTDNLLRFTSFESHFRRSWYLIDARAVFIFQIPFWYIILQWVYNVNWSVYYISSYNITFFYHAIKIYLGMGELRDIVFAVFIFLSVVNFDNTIVWLKSVYFPIGKKLIKILAFFP